MATSEKTDRKLFDDLVLPDNDSRQLLPQPLVGTSKAIDGLNIVVAQPCGCFVRCDGIYHAMVPSRLACGQQSIGRSRGRRVTYFLRWWFVTATIRRLAVEEVSK